MLLVGRQRFVLGCVQGPEQQKLRQLTPLPPEGARREGRRWPAAGR